MRNSQFFVTTISEFEIYIKINFEFEGGQNDRHHPPLIPPISFLLPLFCSIPSMGLQKISNSLQNKGLKLETIGLD